MVENRSFYLNGQNFKFLKIQFSCYKKWFFIGNHWSFTRTHWIFIDCDCESISESVWYHCPSHQKNCWKPYYSQLYQDIIYNFINGKTDMNCIGVNWFTASKFNFNNDLTIVIIEKPIEYALKTLLWFSIFFMSFVLVIFIMRNCRKLALFWS